MTEARRLVQRAANQRYREAHPERLRERDRRRYRENSEQERRRRDVHREAHPAETKAAQHDWYIRNRDRILEQKKGDREANRAAYLKRERTKHEQSRERERAYAKRHRAEHPEKVARDSAVRRARKLGAFAEAVDIREVFDRCGARCHICERDVKWDLAYPHPLSKSVDHLIPLAKGGEHTRINTALAHLHCNIMRGPGRTPAQLFLLVAT